MDQPPPRADGSALRTDALAVLVRLREARHEAYFAGGCVRDELLGLAPQDFDVATDARPPRVRELFKNTQAVGAAFGVILVRQGRSVVEVATFRSDGSYGDGRRPDAVLFTTAQADAQRRDFTINGLFLDPLQNRVIDHVGGQADLAAKVVRAIGDPHLRFSEDHLRLLRAVRFAARLGFAIEPATAAAIVSHAPELAGISPERIADELRRMLTPPTGCGAAKSLQSHGLLDVLMRFLPQKGAGDEGGGAAGDAGGGAAGMGVDLLCALEPATNQPVSFGLALAALTLGVRMTKTQGSNPAQWLTPAAVRSATAAMRQTLKISNDEEAAMAGSLGFGALLNAEPTVAMLKRFLARPYSADARLLMGAAARCDLSADRLSAALDQLAALEQTDFAPPPLISGDDLTAAGAAPGPAFKRALDAVYDEQLEGRMTDRAAALEMAMRLVRG
jgi:tRNA nucleotidyltransferase/poly(A) polymerase